MPMMMHHDGQPLRSRGNLYGLLNQVRFLRRAGAASLQVTSLTPAPGTKLYEGTYRDGLVMDRVAGRAVEDFQFDGNHCIATCDPHPLRKQINIFAAYAAFYNPLNALRTALTLDSLWGYRVIYQLYGMLALGKSIKQALPWMTRLARGPIEKAAEAPRPRYPLVVIEPAAQPSRVRHASAELPILGETVSPAWG
jgi:hypothetical protein